MKAGRACVVLGQCRAALSQRRTRVQTEKERRLRELAEGILRALDGGPKDFV